MARADPQAQVRGRVRPPPSGRVLVLSRGADAVPREGARTPVALNEWASRPAWLTYGVTVIPVNSTAANGDPAEAGGSVG